MEGYYKIPYFTRLLKWENSIMQQSKALPVDDSWRPAIPYFFVWDDDFSLTRHLMKPYSNRKQNKEQQIFNYR